MKYESAAWRDELAAIVSQLGKDGRKTFYAVVGTSRVSVQRWCSGENTPDALHVQKILDAVPPQRRGSLRQLMLQDPKVRRRISPEEQAGEPPKATIARETYLKVLRAARNPSNRFGVLCPMILKEAFDQLNQGLSLSVAICMPPRADGKVRSLLASVEYSQLGLQRMHEFWGAESLAGAAILRRHTVVASPTITQAPAGAAFPIGYGDYVAGTLVISADQPQFFTPERLTLLEQYTDLLRLAFYDWEYVPVSSIDLGLMPQSSVQQSYFASFRRQVPERWAHAQLSLYELMQVDQTVRAHLEEALLQWVTTVASAEPAV